MSEHFFSMCSCTFRTLMASSGIVSVKWKQGGTVIYACKCDMFVLSRCCFLCGCHYSHCLRWSLQRLSLSLPSNNTSPPDWWCCTWWFGKKIMLIFLTLLLLSCSWISIFISSPWSNLTMNWASSLLLPKILCTHTQEMLLKKMPSVLLIKLIDIFA